MKKSLITAGIIGSVAATGLTGVAIANAETSTQKNTNPMSSLVNAIASKFNLNASDVQSVFDEQRAKMDEEREQEVKDEVAQLITDGKLTQEQADKINAKRADLKAERETQRTADQSQTEVERQADREKRKTELDTWLKDNSIDAQYGYLLMSGRPHVKDGGR